MNGAAAFPWPPGYGVRRILSEEVGGIVALAEAPGGQWAVLKVLRLSAQADPDQALVQHRRLQGLTSSPGLLRMTACGLTADRAWLWEELVPAAGLDGAAPAADDTYQPATLRAELIERGRFGTEAVVEIGLVLCGALEVLHGAQLVHRDVKTGNLFRVEGRVVLGDYGLTAEPGTPFDFKGTEGYMPSEGVADFASDLFALGKTLYELWTGCDRLEFPTLPKAVLEGADWHRRGALLNGVLLQACSPQARDRFQTAGDLAKALRGVAAGRQGWLTRRSWITLGTAGIFTAGVVGMSFLFPRRAPVLRWRQRRSWEYVPIAFLKNPGGLLLDAPRRRLLHVYFRRASSTEAVVTQMDLGTWAHRSQVFPAESRDPVHYNDSRIIVHPREGTLWLVDVGMGRVWRLVPDTGVLTLVPTVPLPKEMDERSFNNAIYWNPVTDRLGVLGGYGWFAARNWRWELQADKGAWLQVEPNRPQVEPRCRYNAILMAADGGRRLLWFGGMGSLNGRQDVPDPGAGHFDGRFHRLGDLWRLNLETNRWTQVVPFPGLADLAPSRWSACYLEASRAVLVLHARPETAPFGTPATMHVCRVDEDDRFHEVRSVGDVPDGGGEGFLTALPGGGSAVTFQKQGVFELNLEEE